MKLKLTIDLDLPEEFDTYTEHELRMVVYEEILATVHRSHLEQAMEIAGATPSPEHTNGNLIQIMERAKQIALQWAKITDVPEWTVERL